MINLCALIMCDCLARCQCDWLCSWSVQCLHNISTLKPNCHWCTYISLQNSVNGSHTWNQRFTQIHTMFTEHFYLLNQLGSVWSWQWINAGWSVLSLKLHARYAVNARCLPVLVQAYLYSTAWAAAPHTPCLESRRCWTQCSEWCFCGHSGPSAMSNSQISHWQYQS